MQTIADLCYVVTPCHCLPLLATPYCFLPLLATSCHFLPFLALLCGDAHRQNYILIASRRGHSGQITTKSQGCFDSHELLVLALRLFFPGPPPCHHCSNMARRDLCIAQNLTAEDEDNIGSAISLINFLKPRLPFLLFFSNSTPL